jgi:hypothetical protein
VRSHLRRALAPLAVVLFVLTGCTGVGDEGDETPVVVEEGEEFSFNGWRVSDGWQVTSEEAAIDGEAYQQPNVELTVTNDGESARPTLFTIFFAENDTLLASINCSTGSLEPGESADIVCRGSGEEFPTGYNKIQVERLTR